MRIGRIRLHDFRSYHELDFAPAPGLSVLVGENAAGKTNVLESIFLCALGRSHRTRHDLELIRHDAAGALVGLELSRLTGTHDIEFRLYRDARRTLKVDGRPLARSGELLGNLHVVMFSPEDLRLIKQGPSERRRFLDMELSQLQPLYYYRLQQYNLALKQRNALLKSPTRTGEQLLPFEGLLADWGADILLSRQNFMRQLSGLARDLHHSLSGGQEELQVIYQPNLPIDGKEALKAAFLDALLQSRERDAQRGGTTVGPHRDDILLLVNGRDVRTYGSQGQQRTAALSLKLSELQLMREISGEAPVLLLDDVLSELDETRQQFLVTAMEGCQTLLTCTHAAGLADIGLSDMALYRVQGGGLRRADGR